MVLVHLNNFELELKIPKWKTINFCNEVFINCNTNNVCSLSTRPLLSLVYYIDCIYN